MKYHIRIFVDGYETMMNNLKDTELKPITECIIEYVQQQKYSFAIDMTRYDQPVALDVPDEFKKFNGKRIHLNPFGFHKTLNIQFDLIDGMNGVHHCDDIYCNGYCGTLHCGCIDVCRNRCGMNYDSY
uniref:Uncharacterized protein n=1 Tax=viral metagenome TaxID=1070528 RepID=A0A6C0D6Y3_9ZZZZ